MCNILHIKDTLYVEKWYFVQNNALLSDVRQTNKRNQKQTISSGSLKCRYIKMPIGTNYERALAQYIN